MATDADKSDTDDHERPDPPKRQRTRPVTSVEHNEESVISSYFSPLFTDMLIAWVFDLCF